MPETGKPSKKFKPSHLNEFGTILCSDFDILKQIKLLQEEESPCTVLMLGDFHKRGSVEIKVGALHTLEGFDFYFSSGSCDK